MEIGALGHLVLHLEVPFKAGCACGVLLSMKLGGLFPLQGSSGFPWIFNWCLESWRHWKKEKPEKFNKIMEKK